MWTIKIPSSKKDISYRGTRGTDSQKLQSQPVVVHSAKRPECSNLYIHQLANSGYYHHYHHYPETRLGRLQVGFFFFLFVCLLFLFVCLFFSQRERALFALHRESFLFFFCLFLFFCCCCCFFFFFFPGLFFFSFFFPGVRGKKRG